MKPNPLNIPPELIFSHIWAIRSDARLAVMQQSLDSLIAEIGNPKIIPNDLTVISSLIKNQWGWFSMNCEGYLMSLAKKYEDKFLNLTFKDLVMIVSLYFNYTDLQKRHTKNLLKKYFKRRQSCYDNSTLLFPDITCQTYGLLIYREQAVRMIMAITDMGHEDAKKLICDLRKCTYEAQNYGETFISLGVAKGLPKEKVRRVWALISRQAQLLTDYKFSLALSWLLYQLQYLETYHLSRAWSKVRRFAKQYEHGINLAHIEKINFINSTKEDLDECKRETGILPQCNKKDIEIPSHSDMWHKCKKLLQQRLSGDKFQLFKDVESKSFDNKVLTLVVKDFKMMDKLEKLIDNRRNDKGIFVATLKEVYGDDMQLMYDVETI